MVETISKKLRDMALCLQHYWKRGKLMKSYLVLSFLFVFTAFHNVANANEVDCIHAPVDNLGEEVESLISFARDFDKASKDGWNGYAQAGDSRKVRNNNSPKWLEAVGRMDYVNYKNQKSICTINLVDNGESNGSKVAITNSHCIEDLYRYNRNNISSKVDITFTSNSGKKIKVSIADIFDDGNFRYSLDRGEDYAILILDRTILKSEIKPLVYEADLASNYRDFVFDPEYDNDPEMLKSRRTYKETIAGHSADKNENLGKRGENLTYDDNCKAQEPTDEDYEKDNLVEKVSNCFSYRGSSGGAFVVSYFDSEEENSNGTYGKQINVLVGINASADPDKLLKNGDFDNSYSHVTPVLNFVDSLDEAVKLYN